VFYRCGYKNEKDIHHGDVASLNFQLGKAITVEEGNDCTVFFCGPIGFEAQKAVEEMEVTATAGGGAVEVTVSGKHEVLKVKLSPEVVDPDDIEMLEDLIMAATNEAFRKIEEQSQQSMAKISGGLPF
jgi:DNA-binding YbaB/EbfC family protein